MRSSWPADRVLRLLAAAGVEAAWLALLYVAIQWSAGTQRLALGIGQLGVAAIVGVFLARALRGRGRAVYGLALAAAGAVAAAAGIWLAVAPSVSWADLAAAPAANPGGWLLGVALLLGSTHADLLGDTGRSERLLDAALVGIAVFWVFASATGLARAEPFRTDAYVATLALVSAGLIALGLARLVELQVEGVDRAARWRWLVLVLSVSGVVLLVGIPLAAVLGIPVGAAMLGSAGILAPVLYAAMAVIAFVFGPVLEALRGLVPSWTGPPPSSLDPLAGPGLLAGPSDTGGAYAAAGTDWMVAPLIIGLAWLIVVGIVLLLNGPAAGDALDLDVEIRESERIGAGLTAGLRRPRFAWRRPRSSVPRTARDAYPAALPLLAGRFEERRAGETPREHARRIAPTALGRMVGRLAADYQLIAFAGRAVTPAEERRAIDRWQRIELASRTPEGPAGAPDATDRDGRST